MKLRLATLPHLTPIHLVRLPLAAALAVCAALPASAADYYWDQNGTTAGFGSGGGTWGSSAYWSTSSAGTAATANTATGTGDTVYFGTNSLGFSGANTIDIVSGGVSAGNIFFGSATAQDVSLGGSGYNITLGGTSTITYNGAGGKWVRIYPNLIGGATSVTFAGNGNGNIVLYGTNTYGGSTIIDNATLNISAANALPSATAVTIRNGGRLYMYAAATTVKSVTINNSGGGTVGSGSNTLTLSNGGVRGIYNEAGNNTVSFPIALGSGSSSGGGNNLDFGAAAGTTLTLSGVISSASGYGMDIWGSGGGTVRLSAANTFTGPVNVVWGTLQYGIANALHDSSAVTVGNGTVFDLNGFSDTIAGLTIQGTGISSGGALINNNGTTTSTLTGGVTLANNTSMGGSANILLASAIGGGAYSLTKVGSGTLTLTGANTYTGQTTVSDGTLTLGTGGSINTASPISIASGKVLNLSGSASNQLGAALSGGAVTIAGTLRATTAQAHTMNRAITLNGGTLDSTGGSPADYGTYFFNSDQTITANGTGNTISGNGKVGIAGGKTLTLSTPLAGDVLTVSAGVGTGTANGNTGALAKIGAGSVTLSGANSYTATTTVSGGTLSISGSINSSASLQVTGGTLSTTGADKLANTAAVTVAGGTLTVGGSDTIGSLTMSSGVIGGSNTLTATTYALSGGTVTGNLGTGTLNSSGTVALNGTSAASAVNITAGTLTLGSANRLADGTTVTVSGGTLAMGANNDTVGTVVLTGGSITGTGGVLTGSSYDLRSGSVSAILGGSAALTKSTAGTVTLSAANTYTGTTTVSAGTLALGASGSLASNQIVLAGGEFNVSAVSGGHTLGASQSLTGSGTVTGDIGISGTLAIGASPATMTFNDNLGLNAGSVADFEIIDFTLGNYDLALAAVAGTQGVTFGGGTLNLFFQSGFNTEGSAKIFDFDTYAGSGFNTVNSFGLASGYSASFDASNGIVTVIPEPRAVLLGGLGLLVLLRRRRIG